MLWDEVRGRMVTFADTIRSNVSAGVGERALHQ
jgi:hypothetical protein